MEELYSETKDALRLHGKTFNDVKYIVTGKGNIDVADFISISTGLMYDSGFGSQKISPLLMLVGDNWWLERAEYDGSEWWSFKEKPFPKRNTLTYEEAKNAITTNYFR